MTRFIMLFVFVMTLSSLIHAEVPRYSGKPRGTELTGEKIYTVISGDTMWDICGRELKDPYLWQKVWERNPHITDPNWIYPDDRIDLNINQPVKDTFVKEENKIKYQEGETKQFNFMDTEVTTEPASERKVSGYKPKPVKVVDTQDKSNDEANRLQYEMEMNPFIIESRDKEFGKIIKIENDALNAVLNGIVYINKGEKHKVKEGDEFITYSISSETVEHPITFDNIGEIIIPSGKLKVLMAYKDTSKCQVISQLNTIPVGSSIVTEYSKIVLSEKNIKANYEGYIIYLDKGRNNAGLGAIVFIDRGIRQSVKAGMYFDVFTVKKYTKGLDGTIKEIPSQIKGRIKVINARENTSTCIVVGVETNETISAGDRIVVE